MTAFGTCDKGCANQPIAIPQVKDSMLALRSRAVPGIKPGV